MHKIKTAVEVRRMDIIDYILEDIERQIGEAAHNGKSFLNYRYKFPKTPRGISYSGQIVDAVFEILRKSGYAVRIDYSKSTYRNKSFMLFIDWSDVTIPVEENIYS